MTPTQAVNSPQVALLSKEDPLFLGSIIAAWLMDLTKYINCGWNSKTVSDVAKLLVQKFWMLRVDEFLYIFRRGMDGAYGNVTFAPQQYSNLAQWIITYQETERLEAEEAIRTANIPKSEEPVNEAGLKKTDLLISKLTKKLKEKERNRVDAINQSKPNLSDAFHDSKFLSELQGKEGKITLKTNFDSLLEFCREKNYTRCVEYLEQIRNRIK